MRDTLIADKLRRFDLNVVELAGWKTRGSEVFNPKGFVWHHTAGPAKGNAPSLGVVTNGRAGLPGPLANVFQARDNTIYVVAAGRANHAGSGGWEGLSGNTSVYGIEIENVGTTKEPWRADQIETACRVAAALSVPPKLCCHHKEWAPRRKVDMHTIDGDTMRNRVSELLQEENENMISYIQSIQTGEIITMNWEGYRKISKKQYDRRAWLSAAGGRPIQLRRMHDWAIASFIIESQLVELKPPAT